MPERCCVMKCAPTGVSLLDRTEATGPSWHVRRANMVRLYLKSQVLLAWLESVVRPLRSDARVAPVN